MAEEGGFYKGAVKEKDEAAKVIRKANEVKAEEDRKKLADKKKQS